VPGIHCVDSRVDQDDVSRNLSLSAGGGGEGKSG